MLSSLPTRRTLYHILAWTAFITYEVTMVWFISPPKNEWWEYTGYYIINISLFYFHAHVVLTYIFIKRNRPYLLILLIPLELTVYTMLEYGLENFYNLYRFEPRRITFNIATNLGYIWRAVYFMGISTAYWLMLNTIDKNKKIDSLEVQRLKSEKERSELEKDLVLSQNAFLQAQINPHLLFNTLNFIYNAVQDVSPKASEGVILLSDVMHYALTRVHEDGKTDLSAEVEHIKKYVTLNQLRFSYPLHLDMQFKGRFSQHRIPPLILITFIENTFKHGDLTDPDHPAKINVISRDHHLQFEVVNKKRKLYHRHGFGIGIRNAETRLKKFYGEKGFALKVNEDEQSFSVKLDINLVP